MLTALLTLIFKEELTNVRREKSSEVKD
jgi:hypothetical protein